MPGLFCTDYQHRGTGFLFFIYIVQWLLRAVVLPQVLSQDSRLCASAGTAAARA